MIPSKALVKRYGAFTAVDGVSLDVAPGEIHGFLGPNGAGKTTTIRMIAGPAQADRGPHHDQRARPRARRPRRAKASLGFIPDRPFIYEKLTAGEFLRFHGGLYGMDAARRRASARTRCSSSSSCARWQDELVESFSHGMKQRLVMCAAFLHRPRAVLVDEPMVGLDPRGARLIKDVFRAHEPQRRGHPHEHAHAGGRAGDVRPHQHHPARARSSPAGTVDELLALAGGEDEQLTPVFLKLTGGTGLQEIDEV